MAGFATTFEYQLLKLILNGSSWTSVAASTEKIAINSTTSPLTQLWVSLHYADPTDSGTQGSNEGSSVSSYTAYVRQQTTRSTGTNGWVLASTNGAASPVTNIDFPQQTATSTGTFTHAAVGFSSAATSGQIIFSGTLSPNINLSQNVTPRITTGSSITLD